MRILSAVIICFFSASLLRAQEVPATKKEPKVFHEHDRERVDNYFWLNNPSDSNVIRHLRAENAYVDAFMKPTEPLQKKIYDELVSRIPQKDQSLPVRRNGYWYYSRFDEGKQYPYLLRRKAAAGAKEEMLLDIPGLAKPYKIYLLHGSAVSPDNRQLAYGVDTAGDRRCTVFIRDLNRGQLQSETISNTSGSYAWANDNKTLYYVLNDHTVRPYRVMRHTLGTDPSRDVEIYTEKDSTYRLGLSKSTNNRFIFIHSGSTNTSESRYIDAGAPDARPVMIQQRTSGLEYTPAYYEGEVFHIYTNREAKNFKFVTAPIATPGVENWSDLIPHNPKGLLEGVNILRDFYVTQTKENGLTRIRVFDRKAKKWNELDFGQDAYVANMSQSTDDFTADSIRYSFTSLTTPSAEYLYNLRTGQRKLLKQQNVGTAYHPEVYTTRRVWATATDGTKVPISLVYRTDKYKKDGSNPLHLYAYGSYGASSDPYFNSTAISLVDRGFVYAIAHIRGGQEMGREWYEQGRVMTKKNTFTDFIDAAEYLIKEGYTKPDRLFASGGSAGGMLMGAVTNMRPDLFRGVVAIVPWMDVITDMFNTDLPLTTLEYEEWGDPNRREHYDYMLSWSPMDNVRPAKYPSILATGGLNDTQVPYFSPAKWVAKVRENNLGTNPVLFQVNMGAGHGGESGRFARQKLFALINAFMLSQLGWNEETKTYQQLKAF